MRNFFYLAIISLVMASSVNCFNDDENINYLPRKFCIDRNSCVRNGDYHLCECPATYSQDDDEYHIDVFLNLFCSDTSCKICNELKITLIYAAGFECQCNNTKQYFYCKRSKIVPWMNPTTKSYKSNSWLVNNKENSTTFSKLLINETIVIQNTTKVTNKEEYIWHENSNRQIIIENNNNYHGLKVEKTCVLNDNVNLCDCSSNFRNILKTCDNTYLFCNKTSSCRDCKENFYPEHGFGYKCRCNGIKKDFICKGQADLIEAYHLIETALALIIQTILVFILCSTIACCCACCIGYYTIKGCKNTIAKCFKRDSKVINIYQMVPNDQSPTVFTNRNKLELNEV